MEVSDVLQASLGQEHFGGAILGDKRRSRRLVRAAERIFRHPGGTLPRKLDTPADLKALYRLVDHEAVTHAAVLEPHRQRTLAQMGQEAEPVLVIHDTTELDYSGLGSMQDQLGQLGGGGGRGLLCHNSLAITPARRVIGLASQVLRLRRKAGKHETRQQKRQHPQRESRLWMAGCEAVGPAPAGALWVDICDRGADSYEYLEHELGHGRSFVIRCGKDRTLEGEDHVGSDRVYQHLFSYTRDLPTLGQRQVEVSAKLPVRRGQRTPLPGRSATLPARTATVRVAAGPVTLRAPRWARGQCQGMELKLWVVHVREVDPPTVDAQPLEWLLLTDLPAATFAQACQRVDWYSCRPIIEEYHKAMKSGCGIQNPQFTERHRLEPVIALLSVVAAVLLDVRELARNPVTAHLPADRYIQPCYVQVLCGWRFKSAKPLQEQQQRQLSVQEFCLALARLGGHQNRKNDGPPGWLTLWRGWEKLNLMVDGAAAVGLVRCG